MLICNITIIYHPYLHKNYMLLCNILQKSLPLSNNWSPIYYINIYKLYNIQPCPQTLNHTKQFTPVFYMKHLHHIIKCLILALFTLPFNTWAQQAQNASYPDDPARIALPKEQQGLVIDRTFDNSTIYPGTTRTIKIYIPQQYDGKTPACLLVCLDGAVYYGMTTVMDNLITTGEMPVTIGVFVNPGVIYDKDGNVLRYNRSNEFDRIDGTFARFLETEILPMVEDITLDDGRHISISKKAADRAITGASSGGICSFVAAWSRPDLFSRVYCTVGTFVSMRGGHTIPALIRKTEPKPLRIYLHDGEFDAWNPLFGDWFEYNKLTEAALNFAGYEYTHRWDRSKHNIYHGAKLFPDAMRWLWRGYPNAPKAGKSLNNMLTTVLVDSVSWEETTEPQTIPATNAFPKKLNITNTVSLHNGNTYGTTANGEIWLKRNNEKPIKLNTLADCGSEIAVYPDATLLVQTEKNSDWLVAYTINPDGTLANGEQFYWLHNTTHQSKREGHSMFFDTLGNLYIATESGIQIADQNGRVRAIIPSHEGLITRMTMQGNILYVVTDSGKAFRRTLKTSAHNPADAPITPKSQGQG